jgi:hypothetical protein
MKTINKLKEIIEFKCYKDLVLSNVFSELGYKYLIENVVNEKLLIDTSNSIDVMEEIYKYNMLNEIYKLQGSFIIIYLTEEFYNLIDVLYRTANNKT